jgi:hypothetical protein
LSISKYAALSIYGQILSVAVLVDIVMFDF